MDIREWIDYFYLIGYSFSKVEIKDYNVMIDERNLFDQLAKNDLKTFKNIEKISTCWGDDYTTDCQLDDSYFQSLGSSMKVDLPLTKIMPGPLTKSIFIPFGLIKVGSALDAGIHKTFLVWESQLR